MILTNNKVIGPGRYIRDDEIDTSLGDVETLNQWTTCTGRVSMTCPHGSYITIRKKTLCILWITVSDKGCVVTERPYHVGIPPYSANVRSRASRHLEEKTH